MSTCNKKGYSKKDARIYECDACDQWHITHKRGEGMKS